MFTKSNASRGFTLVELAVTLTVLGLLLAFSVPAFNRINQTYQLKSATQNVSGTLRMWRERSIARSTENLIHFNNFVPGTDWHVHEYNAAGTQIALHGGRKFANGITFYTATVYPRFGKDGREVNGLSGFIVLRNQRGARDTVSVLASGLILE